MKKNVSVLYERFTHMPLITKYQFTNYVASFFNDILRALATIEMTPMRELRFLARGIVALSTLS